MGIDLYALMEVALEEAGQAFSAGEVPVGAVVANKSGEVVAREHNRSIALNDPTAHAEILAIRDACLQYNNYRLNGAILVSSIEPCAMCMGAALNARISRLIFGAYDSKAGAAGSLYNLADDRRLNHRLEVVPGILLEECRALMQEFFRIRRVDQPEQCSYSGEVPKRS